jgi:hypothetical protein
VLTQPGPPSVKPLRIPSRIFAVRSRWVDVAATE